MNAPTNNGPFNFAPLPELSSYLPQNSATSLSQQVGSIGDGAGLKDKLGGLAGKFQTAGQGISALGGLAQIYLGFQANKLAKKDFEFQKSAYRDRLEGTTAAYNTQIADRGRSRSFTEGTGDGGSAYYDKNKLTPRGLAG